MGYAIGKRSSFRRVCVIPVLALFISACTIETIRYVERSPSDLSPISIICNKTYELYGRCYGLGIGESTRECAAIAKNLTQESHPKASTSDADLTAEIISVCELACNEAAGRHGMYSYDTFSKQMCKM
jgi:hypothetical protein